MLNTEGLTSTLLKFLRAPIEADEDVQFAATLLHYILVVTIIVTIIYSLTSILFGFSAELFWINGVALSGEILLYILLHIHKVRLTAWIFFIFLLLLTAFVGVEDGGLTDPHHASSSILIIALAAFVLRRQGIIVFTGFAIAISFIFLMMSVPVFNRPLNDLIPDFILNIVIYVIVGTITAYALASFDKVISRLRASEERLTQLNKVASEQNTRIQDQIQTLSATNSELSTVKENLEERVVERTKDLEKVNELLLLEISERKQAQESLAEARDQAIDALEIKNRILANVSHDVRTPLNVILLRAGLMERHGVLTEKHQTDIENITGQSMQLLELFDNILTEAQSQSYDIQPNYQSFQPLTLLNDSLAGMKSLAKQKGLEITTNLDSQLPLEMLGDVPRLKQIILNLVGNAIKFTDTGSVTIEFEYVSDTQWAIKTSDTGLGISDEHKNGIFKAFWQVDSSVTRSANRGVGLGLSIVKQLVDLMNANIELQSVVGEGSTFIVTLPLLQQEKGN